MTDNNDEVQDPQVPLQRPRFVSTIAKSALEAQKAMKAHLAAEEAKDTDDLADEIILSVAGNNNPHVTADTAKRTHMYNLQGPIETEYMDLLSRIFHRSRRAATIYVLKMVAQNLASGKIKPSDFDPVR